MFLRKLGIGAAVAALLASPAFAEIKDYQLGFQDPQSEIMDRIASFHTELVWIIVAVCLFVLALLVYIAIKFRAGANPVPSKVHHNTLLEVLWTIVPVIILVIIAVPSFKLLYFEADIPPNVDVHIKTIGKQWFWTYEYPGANAGFTYDSLGLSDADAAKAGKPRLLGVDNPIYIPVNKVIEIETAGADVIHSFALPQMGVKMDAVPGRLNHTWFKADHIGVFYGQCSELCGARHAYMPIELHVVSDADYAAWIASAKKKFAALDVPAPRLASK